MPIFGEFTSLFQFYEDCGTTTAIGGNEWTDSSTYSDTHGSFGDFDNNSPLAVLGDSSLTLINPTPSQFDPQFTISKPYTGFIGRLSRLQIKYVADDSSTNTISAKTSLTNLFHNNSYFNPSGVPIKEYFSKLYTNDNRYSDRYDITSSPLSEYALRENSPSALYYQYDKFNLRKDSPNRFSFGEFTDQPFILRGIQRDGEQGGYDTQRWGFVDQFSVPLTNFAEYTDRQITDVIRLSKFYLSPAGLNHIDKLFGLQSVLLSTGLRITLQKIKQASPLGSVSVPLPTTNYSTLSYAGIVAASLVRRGSIQPVDFRTISPLRQRKIVSNYTLDKTERRFGFADPGRRDIQKLYWKRLTPNEIKDKVNLLKTGEIPSGFRQLIKFKFTDINDDGIPFRDLYFRETITGFSDNINPSWNQIKYIGRPSSVAIYEGADRQVSFNFTTYVTAKEEMDSVWNKVNTLASFCYPEYDQFNRMKSPIMTLTIGDWFVNQPGYLLSLSISVDDNAMWEIESGRINPSFHPDEDYYQLPHTLNISITYQVINHQLENKGQIKLFGPAAGPTNDDPNSITWLNNE